MIDVQLYIFTDFTLIFLSNLYRCNQEYDVREYLMHMSPDRLRGFVMFLAEIFTQIKTSDNLPLLIIAESVCELLKLLMKGIQDQNLSCVTKVLKVSSGILSSYFFLYNLLRFPFGVERLTPIRTYALIWLWSSPFLFG